MGVGGRLRTGVWQAAFFSLVALVLTWLIGNALHNLAARGIQTGFGFLTREAGFELAESLIDYTGGDSYARAFVAGLANTVAVSAVGIVLATGLGTLLGVTRLSSNWLASTLAGAYVEVMRNVPLLLQLLVWYGVFTELLPPVQDAFAWGDWAFLSQRGLRLAWFSAQAPGMIEKPVLEGFDFLGGKLLSPEFLALVVGLSTYTAAFVAEVVRGGLLSVRVSQLDAARSLGLTPLQCLRHVRLPLALRAIVAPLTSQFLNLTKNSSLAVAIGYPDLVSVANTTMNQTGQAIEAVSILMAVYLSISLALSLMMNLYERRVRAMQAW